jgi:hypothetical protein
MLRVALALWFGLVTAAAQPVTAEDAAAQLASRIASLVPRGSKISLVEQNLTPVLAIGWPNFWGLFDAELRKAGLEIVNPGSTGQRVRITLSENPRGFLFVADVISGDNHQVALLPCNPLPVAEERPPWSFRKKPLWAQKEPILDVLLFDNDMQMLVLDANKVASFRFSDGKWIPSATASLILPRPIPRDPRGRIEAVPEGFRVFIPGATCAGTLQPDLKVTCAPGNETWSEGRVRWVTDRNMLESDAVKAPFYSIANGFFGGAEGWGSDIAAVEDPCAGAPAVIASGAATDHDEVRAYNSQATPASEALPLPGPVTALWPAEKLGQVTLVVHNLHTGEYEASSLGLACSPQ